MSKIVFLSNGGQTIVDNIDYKKVSKLKWTRTKSNVLHNGYDKKTGERVAFTLHKFLMNTPKGFCVDHINGNPYDNRRSNLRICTTAQNTKNRGMSKHNTSGYKGVCFYKNVNKWVARITNNKKQYCLGYFSDKIDAAIAYNNAATTYHGEFARLNIINYQITSI